MMKECPFNSRSKCDIWGDYQVACVALQEAVFFQLERNQLSARQSKTT